MEALVDQWTPCGGGELHSQSLGQLVFGNEADRDDERVAWYDLLASGAIDVDTFEAMMIDAIATAAAK